ncbi:glycosyltransferase family 24 protein [Coniochaeta ligniaria NRRL 30616]|uniref:Glycosyltransferase family 24 protein n=1 Tax=Coniochaeta ligniaria NRRL 30616 TaxID=1408157 RepID=A0A1J7IG35_9PEZI|nr:glycosyltransferase family 24 protein [Coniochaeta ligniaria NRRL 30616]
MIRLSQLPWGLTVALLAATWLPSVRVLAAPSVNVALNAAFPSPPYLVELLETAAQENETSYFPLLDRIAQGAFSSVKTDQELYEKFLEVLHEDGHITNPEALSTFKLALSMRSAAPRIEAHYQYYSTAVENALPTTGQEACLQWYLVDGKQYCEAASSEHSAELKDSSQQRTLPFDRVQGTGSRDVVLYADITSPAFAKFHFTARGLVERGEGTYRVRYTRSPEHPIEPLTVNGYGVELALKRTDYIVIDDRQASESPSGNEAQKVVLDEDEEITDLKPLEKSDLPLLGLKAASFVLQSESPFETLLKLTQDFPKYSTSVAAHDVSTDFETEHRANRMQMVPAGVNVLWMNGVQLTDRQIQPFALADLLRGERKLINGVLDLGLTGQEAVALLGHSDVAAAKAEPDAITFDWRDEIEEGKVIIWLNNIEKDKRYDQFSKSLSVLLNPTMPGQLPHIRRDMFNLIVPVDFTKVEDLEIITGQLLTFMKRLVPIRFGLVPLTPTGESIEQAKVVYHLLENYGLGALATYLEALVEEKKASKANEELFEKAINDRKLRADATPLPFKEIATSEHHEKQIHLAKHWAERLHANVEVPPVFFNGFAFPREQGWLGTMQQRLGADLRSIQEGVYYGLINEDAWLPGHFLQNAVTRRNVYIFPEDSKALTVLNINKVYTEHSDLFSRVPVLEADERSTKEDWAALTVIADLDNVEGQKLLFYALKFRHENPGVRLDIVHNPKDTSWSAAMMNERVKIRQDILPTIQRLQDLESVVQGGRTDPDPAFDAALARFLASANIKSGDNMLMLNGRLIGPIASAEEFKPEDFQQFLAFERANRILPVYKAIEDLGLGDKVSGPLDAAKLSSVTALSTMSDVPEGIFESAPSLRISAFNVWNTTHTSFEVGDKSTATIQFVALLDPASEQGQKWAPVLKVLSELEGVYLRVFLNPNERLTELPVKRFYRYVLDSAPTFDDQGKVQALSATFNGIPSEALLTAGMDVPPAWLVSSKISVDDLDNLKLREIKNRRGVDKVEAIYELEHILIEGHSREQPGGQPPKGAQLVLATETDPHFADTIIMANLGYFQFKANPGFYNIHLEEGRSSDIFSIESIGASGWAPVPGDEGTEVALMGFQGTTLYPRLVRKPGMETEDVLEEAKAGTGAAGAAIDFVNKGLKFAEGILGKGKSLTKSETEHAEINIFSVASGHLYERMLNIMMVSVMRHTKHTVKFWFIEQFLSPSFKDFIPAMAAEYGFKYEMVTYKWPHWLRAQKEKQRQIWGYKILFLDVLFPLSLDKVIFVDADQIVRTDMYDLVQLDLGGAPYGFTPMCDSRTEMEGFRFWKQGYWANYLRGLPYHISALYVVDLRRFRELAAGDRLRQQYHQLSADPQSLSNLDQDLPNHMQFVIPIHSLPQEWLWCETWCSDETLASARTIDLCNNPQTKEPKLDRARRQVPEWNEYDDEIAALARRHKAGKIGTGADEKEAKPKRFEDGEVVKQAQGHVKDEL